MNKNKTKIAAAQAVWEATAKRDASVLAWAAMAAARVRWETLAADAAKAWVAWQAASEAADEADAKLTK